MESRFKTFVFLDCETTGLESWSKITELCLMAIQTNHLLLGSTIELPRVLNKLTLCFNPNKLIHPAASQVTGLFNDTLEDLSVFNEDTVELLQHFINHLPPPVCLVAHNGNKFDFPLLRNHIKREQYSESLKGLFTVDTLQLFRSQYNIEKKRTELKEEEELKRLPKELQDDDWDDVICEQLDKLDHDAEFLKKASLIQQINEKTPTKQKVKVVDNDDFYAQPTQKLPEQKSSRKKLNFGKSTKSFKLVDVYERLTGLKVLQSHAAEIDVIMMAKCATAMGQDFIMLANELAVPFMEKV